MLYWETMVVHWMLINISLFYWKTTCHLFLPTSFPCPISTLQNSSVIWERSWASLYYYSQQGKLMVPFIILLMLAQSYCCPCLCCASSTVLMRIEIKLKKLAFVSAASSYDSEHREPADLVRRRFSPLSPSSSLKIVMLEYKTSKNVALSLGFVLQPPFWWLWWQMKFLVLPVLHGLNISKSLSTSQGLHIWVLTMRDPELSMSSDFENFLLGPGGCCQNRLLYWVTQCCFQTLPETKYRGMRKANRSYWSISEFSEKFGSTLIPVKLREGWSRKIFPNQNSHAKALRRQACVNFTTVLHSWSGPARLCIQTDEGKNDAHTQNAWKNTL